MIFNRNRLLLDLVYCYEHGDKKRIFINSLTFFLLADLKQ